MGSGQETSDSGERLSPAISRDRPTTLSIAGALLSLRTLKLCAEPRADTHWVAYGKDAKLTFT